METSTSIYGKTMKRVGINLPVDPHCLINCHGTTLYQIIDKLWNAVNTSVGVYDENSKALEEFTKNVAEWAAEFQAQIIALVQGGGESGDPLGVIGWNSFTNELKDKLQKCLITGGRFEQDANGLMWLRLTTDHAINNTISIRIPDGMFGGAEIGPGDLNFTFNEGAEDCTLNYGEHGEVCVLPYANGLEGGDDDLEPCAGIMRASQAKKLDNFDIVDDTLIFNGRKYVLQPLVAITGTDYSEIDFSLYAATANAGANSTTTLTLRYSQIKTVTYEDGHKESQTITTGATVDSIVIDGEYVDRIVGNTIYWKKNESQQSRSVLVTATISLNGKSATVRNYEIWQKGAAAPDVEFYIGQASGAASAFTSMTQSALVENADKLKITAGTRQTSGAYLGSYLHSKVNEKIIYYVMYPVEKSEFVLAILRAGNVETKFTENDGSWNAPHENVVIDGIEYAVRGYRNTSLVGYIMDLYIKQK